VDGAKNKSILKWFVLGRSDLYCKNSWFTGGNGDLTYLKWENHYPRYNFLFVRSVFANIEIRRIWCCFKQSMPYFGYKPDGTI
jgi:hypothetical protein